MLEKTDPRENSATRFRNWYARQQQANLEPVLVHLPAEIVAEIDATARKLGIRGRSKFFRHLFEKHPDILRLLGGADMFDGVKPVTKKGSARER